MTLDQPDLARERPGPRERLAKRAKRARPALLDPAADRLDPPVSMARPDRPAPVGARPAPPVKEARPETPD